MKFISPLLFTVPVLLVLCILFTDPINYNSVPTCARIDNLAMDYFFKNDQHFDFTFRLSEWIIIVNDRLNATNSQQYYCVDLQHRYRLMFLISVYNTIFNFLVQVFVALGTLFFMGVLFIRNFHNW